MYTFLRTRPNLVFTFSRNIFKHTFYFPNKNCSFKLLGPVVHSRQFYLTMLPCRTGLFQSPVYSIKNGNNNPVYKSSTENTSVYIKKLCKIFKCSIEDAGILYYKHDTFVELNIHKLKERVELLLRGGILSLTIQQNFWLLFFDSDELYARLKLLERWKFNNINNAINILQLPFMKLAKQTLKAENDFGVFEGLNKMTYFASLFKCHEREACELFMKYSFMMTINSRALKNILTIVKDEGVLAKDLLSDPWLFRYSAEFLSNRITLLHQIGAKEKCRVIKPWMLRCSQSTLSRYFELKDENIAARGSYTNLKDLLTNELDLTEDEVEEMFLKHPPLAKISYSKAKEMIDFIKAEGFDSKMIHQVPRVLCHKQATLVARMLELKKVNPRMISLQNICRNKKDYIAFLNRMQGHLT